MTDSILVVKCDRVEITEDFCLFVVFDSVGGRADLRLFVMSEFINLNKG